MLRQRGVDHLAATWGMIAETVLIISPSTLVALAFGAPLISGSLFSAAKKDWLPIAILVLVAAAALVALALLLRRRIVIQELVAPSYA
jgi:hypothetical protein